MQTLLTPLVVILLSLAPYDDPARLQERARIIEQTTSSLEEQALLVAVDFNETTLGRRGIPFGATGIYQGRLRSRAQARREHRPIPPELTTEDAARSVLGILRRVRPWCERHGQRTERHWARMLGFFHHGDGCVSDAYSIREARLAARVLARLREAHGVYDPSTVENRPSCTIARRSVR